eukprot:gene16906-35078_t
MNSIRFLRAVAYPTHILLGCIAVCFYPILVEWDLPIDSDSAMAAGFRNHNYLFSVVAGIAVALPMLLDYVFDRFSSNQDKIAKGLIPRRDVLLTLMLPNIIVIAFVIPYQKYSYFVCMWKIRELFYAYSFLSYSTTFCKPMWTAKSVLVPCLSLGISEAIGALNAFNTESFATWHFYEEILN